MTVVVDLHYLELDHDLAHEANDLWWSAEWGPDGVADTEESSPSLVEIVKSVVASIRHRGEGADRIDWRLHQAPGDPSIAAALDTTGMALPEYA